MNHKKYIFIGGIVLIIGAALGVTYYFTPASLGNIFSDNSDTNILASNTEIVSSSDVNDPSVSSSTDDQVIEAPAPPQKIAKATSSKKKNPENSEENVSAVTIPENNTNTISVSDTSVTSQTNAIQIISSSTCSFPDISSSNLSRQIIFNEIAWMGSASSSNAEWIEIKNISSTLINLAGWELLNASGKITINFSAQDSISAGGLLLLSRSDAAMGKIYSGNLTNSGDSLAIIDPQCDVSDILNATSGWPAGNNTTKQTMERDADGIGWHTSVSSGGTPASENSAVVPPIPKILSSSTVGIMPSSISFSPSTTTFSDTVNTTSTDSTPTSTTINSTSDISTAHILITTVQINGSSSSNDFVKLYNPGQVSVDMSGWKLHKRSNTGTEYSLKVFPTGSVIGSGSSFIWANATNGFSETIGANVSSTETLSADNSVALLDASGTIVDALAWGSGTGQYAEGSPYPTDPTNGQLLTRQSVNGSLVDTSNNANDFILQ